MFEVGDLVVRLGTPDSLFLVENMDEKTYDVRLIYNKRAKPNPEYLMKSRPKEWFKKYDVHVTGD